MTRLILHFDVNETILVGDPAGGDSFEDCLNKIICKKAFVRRRSEKCEGSGICSGYTWHDGSPLVGRKKDLPPPPLLTEWEWPEGCVPFYEIPALKREFAKCFTAPNSPGCIYEGVYKELDDALRLKQNAPIDRRLSHDGVYHYIIPAFFNTLHQLAAQGRDFSVVIRTFGTDGPMVADAINAWAEGHHPIPGVPELRVSSAWTARFDPAGRFSATRSDAAAAAAAPAVLDEEAFLELIESGRERCVLVQDDYAWWAGHGYDPSAGKPLWLTLADDAPCHHVFFDDNIHNKPHDSIVAVRARPAPAAPFAPLDGAAALRLQGAALVRVPAMEPIRDPAWFLARAAECERRRGELRRLALGDPP